MLLIRCPLKFLLSIIGCAFLISSCSTLPTFNLSNSEKSIPYERGVFHVHSLHSHDSSGSLHSIKRIAKHLNLDFVIITDHNNLNAKSELPNNQSSEEPLIMVGNEISTTDGHLISLGTEHLVETPVEPQDAIDQIREHNGYSVIAHPICDKAAWKDWNVSDYSGIEVFNHACNFYDSNKALFFLKSLLLPPELFTKHTLHEPREMLNQWDSLLKTRPLPAFGAVDAHERFGAFGFNLIRYNLLFRSVTIYVQKSNRNESAILNNLFSGKSFIVFESLGKVEEFEFTAQSGSKTVSMGETVQTENPVSLFVKLNQSAEIHLIQDGVPIRVREGKSLSLDMQNKGVYRVEVFKNGRLWIISNPIRVNA